MPIDSRTPQPAAGGTVLDLLSMAEEAARARALAAARRGLSRAARLSLIDQLSRWGGSGLAVLAGTAIFIAVVVARDLPLRSTVWALVLLCSLYFCRRYRKEFRRGDHIASRPFRWRAYYTSAIAVVSAAFGAGAFLLVDEPSSAAMRMIALMVAAAVVAAALNAAHRPAAAAAGLPAFLASLGASGATFGATAFTLVLALAGGAGAVMVAFVSAAAERRAALRFPRTMLQRRDREDRRFQSGASAATRSSIR